MRVHDVLVSIRRESLVNDRCTADMSEWVRIISMTIRIDNGIRTGCSIRQMMIRNENGQPLLFRIPDTIMGVTPVIGRDDHPGIRPG
nr:hypothetical protein [Evansella clarkii]